VSHERPFTRPTSTSACVTPGVSAIMASSLRHYFRCVGSPPSITHVRGHWCRSSLSMSAADRRTKLQRSQAVGPRTVIAFQPYGPSARPSHDSSGQTLCLQVSARDKWQPGPWGVPVFAALPHANQCIAVAPDGDDPAREATYGCKPCDSIRGGIRRRRRTHAAVTPSHSGYGDGLVRAIPNPSCAVGGDRDTRSPCQQCMNGCDRIPLWPGGAARG
jgi:hypothetical protein